MSCCDRLEAQLRWSCDVHEDPSDCPDVVIIRTERGVGLPVHDGGSSSIEIAFCPWCGTKLTHA